MDRIAAEAALLQRLISVLSYTRLGLTLRPTGGKLGSAGRGAGVGLMLVLWMATVLVAFSPDFHEWLHHDSQNGDHACLVTCFSKSQILSGASTGVIIPADTASSARPSPRNPAGVSSLEDCLCPCRAPPRDVSFAKG
jgi:hypothetical protein